MLRASNDTGYGFAIGRVRALEGQLFDDSRWDRLIRSRDRAEFLALLADTAYGQLLRDAAPGAAGEADVAAALARAAEENFDFFAGYCRDRAVLDAFRVRADAHNLKLAAKAALAGREADPAHRLGYGRWSEEETRERGQGVKGSRGQGVEGSRGQGFKGSRGEPGTAPSRTRSSRGVGESGERYREAVEEFLRAGAEGRPEPARLDALLDRATQAEIIELVGGNAFLAGYFARRADVANLLALVRVRLLGEERAELAVALLPGGTLKPPRLLDLHGEDWDALAARLRPTRYGRMMEEGLARVRDERSTLRMERLGRELALEWLARARRLTFGFEPLVGYYLFRENEIGNLRRLNAAKRAGLDATACAEVVARG